MSYFVLIQQRLAETAIQSSVLPTLYKVVLFLQITVRQFIRYFIFSSEAQNQCCKSRHEIELSNVNFLNISPDILS